MISSDVIRGYNDLIILSLLNKSDSYGYLISNEIEKISDGNYIIKETTLYSAFTRLEKNGYIVSYAGQETNGRARTYYSITDMGKAYFLEKCNEWDIMKITIDKFIN